MPLYADDAYIAQRLAQVDEFMRQRKVPVAIAERVHNYYNYILQRQLSSEQSFIMEGGWGCMHARTVQDSLTAWLWVETTSMICQSTGHCVKLDSGLTGGSCRCGHGGLDDRVRDSGVTLLSPIHFIDDAVRCTVLIMPKWA